MIRVAGGAVLTPRGWREADLWIEGDTVVAVGGEGRLTADQVFDASGMLVGPGFVDLHTHLREPGQTWKENVESGTRAAAAGGYTAVVAMPNTIPPIDRPDLVSEVRRTARAAGHCHVVVAACLTVGRSGLAPVDVAALIAGGTRLFTDDGDSVADSDVLREVMVAVSSLGGVVAQHAEDPILTADGQMHLGPVSRNLGMAGIPSKSEWAVVARDIELAASTGVAYHVQHLSTAESVGLVRDAKTRGLHVTAEVTPHHLSLEEGDLVGLNPNLKMYPPLRGSADREALLAGLRDGTIDAVATDHAPHTRDEKDVPFAMAPRGVIGLETAASVVWAQLGDATGLFDVMSSAPARIAGLPRHGVRIAPGSPANLVIFDTRDTWTPESFNSRSANSPFLGRELRGRVAGTIFEGRMTHMRVRA